MTGAFIKLRCNKCKNEQVTFAKAANHIKCLVCGEPLATSTGGRTKVQGQVLEMHE